LKAQERQHALDQLLADLNQDARLAAFKRDTAYNRMLKSTKLEDLIAARAEELDAIAHQNTVSSIKQAQQQEQAKAQ
jgi:hypothetical protein